MFPTLRPFPILFVEAPLSSIPLHMRMYRTSIPTQRILPPLPRPFLWQIKTYPLLLLLLLRSPGSRRRRLEGSRMSSAIIIQKPRFGNPTKFVPPSLSLVRSQSLIEEEGGEGEREAGTGIPFGTKKTAKKFGDPKINFCNAVRPSESNKDFFFLSPFQNLKNQIMTTNLWVEQVQWQL